MNECKCCENDDSYVMIHQLNMDGTWGKFEDFKDQMENLEQFMDRFKDIYTRETKIPDQDLRTLLRRDIFMVVDKCIEWDVVDSV